MNDPLSDIPWTEIIPTVLKVPFHGYKHRHLVQKWWTLLVHAMGKGGTDVVITGRTCVGKSLLSGRLRGITEDLMWDLPDVSRDVESSVLSLGEWARIVRVIPGQAVRQGDMGLFDAFNRHDNLQGVIHVVDWGYTPERDPRIRNLRIQKDGFSSLEKWRSHNLDLELKEFERICLRIRETHSRCRRPLWLAVAVNKCDLYMDRLKQAQEYYHPESDSDFARILADLTSQVGKNNLATAVVPVSSWDKNFEWNGEVVESNVGGTSESRALLRHFVKTLSSLAEQGDKAQ